MAVDSDNRFHPADIPQKQTMSRRAVVFGGLALALSACKPNWFIPEPEKFSPIDNRTEFTPQRGKETFDSSYLPTLFAQLAENKSNPDERAQAVIDHLSYLTVGNGYSGTAVQIDESGYYLTAGHIFGVLPEGYDSTLQDSPSFVYHPKTGLKTPVNNYVIDESLDLAIFFAPAGKERGPVPHLGLRTNTPAPGEKLWMFALYPDRTRYSRGILNGQVIAGPVMKYEAYQGQMYVEGMKPFGGASGSPVVDATGRIVGIESGGYPYGEGGRDNFQGAIVSNMHGITKLLENARQGQVKTLPTR